MSGDATYRQSVIDMASFLKSELESLGVKVTLVNLGKHVMDGQELDLPPAILGEIGHDKNKKTVALYAHYDVQPVSHTTRSCAVYTTCSTPCSDKPSRSRGMAESASPVLLNLFFPGS